MSYDGQWIWINSVNVPSSTASVHHVSMDGLTDEDLSDQFVGLNHQLTVLPDETVVFDAYGTNGCDDIKQRAPDGTVTTIVNAQTAHGGSGACHVNAIGYSKMDDTIVFSDLDNDDLTKITRTGSTVWVLNGVGNTFTGDSWQGGEHGFDILGLDDIVLFANNSTDLRRHRHRLERDRDEARSVRHDGDPRLVLPRQPRDPDQRPRRRPAASQRQHRRLIRRPTACSTRSMPAPTWSKSGPGRAAPRSATSKSARRSTARRPGRSPYHPEPLTENRVCPD